MKLLKYVLMAVLTLSFLTLASGCGSKTEAELEKDRKNYPEKNTTAYTWKEKDGCIFSLNYLSSEGQQSSQPVYSAKCSNTLTTTDVRRSGKTNSTHVSVSKGGEAISEEDLKSQLAEIQKQKQEMESKKKALEKLTPEEKKLLGL